GINSPIAALALSIIFIITTAILARMASPQHDLEIFALASALMVMIPSLSWDLNYLVLLPSLLALYLSERLPLIALSAYGLIVLERYWPLLPMRGEWQSFAFSGALLLWCACAASVVQSVR